MLVIRYSIFIIQPSTGKKLFISPLCHSATIVGVIFSSCCRRAQIKLARAPRARPTINRLAHAPTNMHTNATNERTGGGDVERADSDKHHVCLHISIRLCDTILFIFTKSINHPPPSRQECEKIDHEQCNLQAGPLQAGLVACEPRGRQEWHEHLQHGHRRRPRRLHNNWLRRRRLRRGRSRPDGRPERRAHVDHLEHSQSR